MLITLLDASWTPLLTGLLTAAAVIAVWLALAPVKPGKAVSNRLQDFVDRSEILDAADMERSLSSRALMPLVSKVLTFFGGLMPQKDMAQLSIKLSRAGDPGGLTVLDFVGLRLILAAAGVAAAIYLMGSSDDWFTSLRNGGLALLAGFMLPKFWLNQKIKKRQVEIARALPDALDMLTIGVEAGLAFESALLRVGDQWNNALSQEFRRVVSEMRIGVPRNESLRRMADRTGVEDLSTFVAVLIQSNTLGVSISQVLHTQADQMRLKRRQQAEEMAHAATVKIVVVLVFFILPSLFIVILGPAAPRIYDVLSGMSGRYQ
jgi:tight adherence protein C